MRLHVHLRMQAREHVEPKRFKRISGKSTDDGYLSHPDKRAPQPPTISDYCQQVVENRDVALSSENVPHGSGNSAEPILNAQTYCSLSCARNLSRLARSRCHGRMDSFAASGSKAEPFEDGDRLRGEAVDNEEDALAKRFSRGRLNVVDVDDQLAAAERLDTVSLRLFNS